MKHLTFTTIILALALSGCGALKVPSESPAQVQASAIAAAATMVAQTLAAEVAITPTLESTDTPFPTDSPFPTFALTPMTEISTTVTPGVDNCHHGLDVGAAGKTHSTLIKNETTDTISLSLSLYKPNAFGQCGYVVVGNIHKGGSDSTDLPAGYYSAFAWAKGKAGNFTVGGSFYVQPATSMKMEVCVRTDRITYKPAC
jgi:hypothetical protein